LPKTDENLKAAFAGESQANRRYLAFAKRADKEGLPQIARLFRAAAEAETVHALSHLEAMGGVKSSKENLKAAIEGETHEFRKMYPEFLKVAREENAKWAALTFQRANAVEEVHAGLFKVALEKMGSLESKDYYVCQVCGYTAETAAPDKCPICGARKEMFSLVR